MKIIDSTIIEDLAQRPGYGRDVVERHTWSDGTVSEVRYRAADKADVKAVMLARVPVLERQRAAREAAEAERLAAEQRQADAIKRLDAKDVADVLMITVSDAERRGAKTEEVSRG